MQIINKREEIGTYFGLNGQSQFISYMKLIPIITLLFSYIFLSFNLEKENLHTSSPQEWKTYEYSVVKRIDEMAIQYIETYKDLAIVEMYRSGIPASIILAQALHESNYGMSPLAVNANNHFGIKCKTYWIGQKYYHKDDDFDDHGRLTDSCFRSYTSTLESYVDHSNFLMSSANYTELFNYNRTDYVSWANGLKLCGYATDTRYASKIISKIEKYDLYQYDVYESPYRTILKQ